jgi:hypothetical protein
MHAIYPTWLWFLTTTWRGSLPQKRLLPSANMVRIRFVGTPACPRVTPSQHLSPPLFSSIVAICDLFHSVNALGITMDLLDSMSSVEEKLMFSSSNTASFRGKAPSQRGEAGNLSRH